jgi:hypothetical protein
MRSAVNGASALDRNRGAIDHTNTESETLTNSKTTKQTYSNNFFFLNFLYTKTNKIIAEIK